MVLVCLCAEHLLSTLLIHQQRIFASAAQIRYMSIVHRHLEACQYNCLFLPSILPHLRIALIAGTLCIEFSTIPNIISSVVVETCNLFLL